jgi:hypothetical protein
VIRPVTRERLVEELAQWLAVAEPGARVALDGPPCADPHGWAEALAAPLAGLGRRLEHVRADFFWRDASLRLEHGRDDPDSYRQWLDERALRREVLEPSDAYLPSLRDPATNRSTRAAPRPLDEASLLVVSGSLLLGRDLPFDATIHLAMSSPARARRTDPAEAWTLAAFDGYDREVAPARRADVVVRCDDPARPAVTGLPAGAQSRPVRRQCGRVRSVP